MLSPARFAPQVLLVQPVPSSAFLHIRRCNNFDKIRTNTNISTSAKFDKICTTSNLSLFVFSAYIYTKSNNFDLFNWENSNLHDNCENDSDRADTRDERSLGKISVTACMSLVRILLKRADTGGSPTLLTTKNLSRNKSSKFSWSGKFNFNLIEIFLVRKLNFKLIEIFLVRIESLRAGFFSQPVFA